ncbi:hypothetical protein [Salinarimonas soli]|nr:hypothetical protein [Salinarimonas soli]
MIRSRPQRRPTPPSSARAIAVMRAFIRTLERLDGRPPMRAQPEGRR